jgi:hypothetical protein
MITTFDSSVLLSIKWLLLCETELPRTRIMHKVSWYRDSWCIHWIQCQNPMTFEMKRQTIHQHCHLHCRKSNRILLILFDLGRVIYIRVDFHIRNGSILPTYVKYIIDVHVIHAYRLLGSVDVKLQSTFDALLRLKRLQDEIYTQGIYRLLFCKLFVFQRHRQWH